MKVCTEPGLGLVGRNLQMLVMVSFALLCTIITGNYWTLVLLGSLKFVIWTELQREERTNPFFVRWGWLLSLLAMVAAMLGFTESSSAIAGTDTPGRMLGLAALLCFLQSWGGYLLVDIALQEFTKPSLREWWLKVGRLERILLPVGVAIAIGTSIWIRYRLQ